MPTDTELNLELILPRSLDVMTRVLRLPTASLRQARAIVRMQMDRLSPLPARDVVFDLVPLKSAGTETAYALGVLRRAALRDPAYASRRVVTAARTVEGAEVVFRFANTFAVDDREARWLAAAPQAALVALGLAAVALAGQIRADQWREQRLPEIAAAQRAAARETRDARDRATAVRDWTALGRADAATRFLCVAGLVHTPLALSSAAADARSVTLTPADGAQGQRLEALGGTVGPVRGGGAASIIFAEEICR